MRSHSVGVKARGNTVRPSVPAALIAEIEAAAAGFEMEADVAALPVGGPLASDDRADAYGTGGGWSRNARKSVPTSSKRG